MVGFRGTRFERMRVVGRAVRQEDHKTTMSRKRPRDLHRRIRAILLRQPLRPEASTPQRSGAEFKLGDRVTVRCIGPATVVAIIELRLYAEPLREGSWNSLGQGVVVRLDDGALIHFREPKFFLQHLK